MTQAELYTELKSLGLPVTYSHYEKYQKPPFIVYFFDETDDLIADGYNYANINGFSIELYTKTKDLTNEAIIEAKLKSLEIPYTKNEVWIDTEKLFRVLYEITII